MPSIHDLPDELLLKIVWHIRSRIAQPSNSSQENETIRRSQVHLTQTALVSHRLRRISEDVLYRSPCLPRIHYFCPPYVVPFVRTLFERPDLLQKIRHLDITTMPRTVGNPPSAWVLRNCTEFVQKLGDERSKAWRDRIADGIEPAIAGVILAMVPPLEHLSIRVLHNDSAHDWLGFTPDHYNALEQLFSCAYPDLTQVRGLSQLPTVKFTGGLVEPPWLSLPQLRVLELGFESDFYEIALGTQQSRGDDQVRSFISNSTISKVIIELNTRILLPLPATWDHYTYRHFPDFLAQLQTLKDLDISIHNTKLRYYESLPPDPISALGLTDPMFQNLVDRLSPCSRSLETLSIRLCPTTQYQINEEVPPSTWHDIVSPAMTLRAFSRLKSLTVDANFFIKDEYFGAEERQYSMAEVLPLSLEFLGIRNSSPLIFHPLNELIRDKAVHLPSLNEMKFLFDYGETPAGMVRVDPDESVLEEWEGLVRKLESAHITVHVEGSMKQIWVAENPSNADQLGESLWRLDLN